MKKIILIGVLVLALLIAGCGKDQQITGGVVLDKKTEVNVVEEVEEKAPVKEVEEVKEIEEAEDVMSETLQKAIAGQQKISSYKYTLYGNLIADKIYVKGSKMRYDISKNKQRDFVSIGKYDAAYLDKTKEEAYYVCIDITCENRNELEEADYDELIMETPMEMIKGITYKSDIVATEMCDVSKPCNKVKVEFADGKTGYIWIDNYYGFPHKIQKGTKMYDFVSVAVNAVKDSDVALP